MKNFLCLIFLFFIAETSLAQLGRVSTATNAQNTTVLNRPDGVSLTILIVGGDTLLQVDSAWIREQTDGRVDSVINSVNQFAFITPAEGWYEKNIRGQKEAPFTITPLSRGVGNMDMQYDLSGNGSLRSLGARVDGEIDGEITIYLYKNGYNTSTSVTLSNNTKEIQYFDYDVCTFTKDDYFDLRWKYLDYGSSKTPSIKAWAEIVYSPLADYTYEEQANLTLTAMAIDSGQVAYFRIIDGTIADSNAATLNAGDYVCAVARPQAGFDFVVWTGMPFTDESYRNNDTAYFYMPSNSQTLRARFRKATKTYAIIISDPCDEVDSSHAKDVRTALLAGNAADGGNLTADSILIYKEANLQNGESYRIADRYGADVVVRSTGGAWGFETIAQKYYPTMTFVPTSNNIYMQAWNTSGNLPCMVLTGASVTESGLTDTNVTAYDIEWHTYDNAGTGTASYANGYLAGCMYAQIEFYIMPSSGWHDWWGFRKVLRDNYIWTAKNGYGKWITFTTFDLTLSSIYDVATLTNKYFYLQSDLYLQR